MKKIRLFVEESKIYQNLELKISENNFEYLSKVMRCKIGDEIAIFNGIDGEFLGKILQIEKKYLALKIGAKISDLKEMAKITLAFAPIKNIRIDFIAQKATELGVSSFQPILTQRTIVDKINSDRFKANVKEALEQCERNDFPQILTPKKLSKLIEEDSTKKIFILCDESGEAEKASTKLVSLKNQTPNKEIVVLIGPEGGFSKEEFAKMRQLKNLFGISLGPRILRADTAMIAALTLVQEFLGDF